MVATITLLSSNYHYGLIMSRNGSLIYITTDSTVVQVTISTGVVVLLAGTYGMFGFNDGVGSNALFSYPQGIA